MSQVPNCQKCGQEDVNQFFNELKKFEAFVPPLSPDAPPVQEEVPERIPDMSDDEMDGLRNDWTLFQGQMNAELAAVAQTITSITEKWVNWRR